MTNREMIGEQLAGRLYAAETALDQALECIAHYAALLPQARAQAYVSATTGQKAFTGAAGAIAAVTEARGQLVESHNALAALARKLGLDILAVGPVDKPEDTPPIGGGGGGGGVAANLNKSLPAITAPC